MSVPAFADHGSSSPSSISQSVLSSSHSPAAEIAARIGASSSSVRATSKNGRPVRV
jgi:hypothetical protein